MRRRERNCHVRVPVSVQRSLSSWRKGAADILGFLVNGGQNWTESPPQEASGTYARDIQHADRPGPQGKPHPHRETPPTQESPTHKDTHPYWEAPPTRYPPIQGSPTHTGKPYPHREPPPTHFGEFLFPSHPVPLSHIFCCCCFNMDNFYSSISKVTGSPSCRKPLNGIFISSSYFLLAVDYFLSVCIFWLFSYSPSQTLWTPILCSTPMRSCLAHTLR